MTHYKPDITILTSDQIWSEGVLDSGRVYTELMNYLNQYDTKIATCLLYTSPSPRDS